MNLSARLGGSRHWLLALFGIACVILFFQWNSCSPFQIGTTVQPEPAQGVKPVSPLCSSRFLRYEPSEYEQDWHNNIEEKRHRICDLLAQETSKTVPLMTASYVWSKNLPARELPLASTLPLFSRMVFQDTCTNEVHAELIEPLFGMLRDPFTICKNVPAEVPRDLFGPMGGGGGVQSKAWLLSAAYAPNVDVDNKNTITSYGSARIKSAPKRILIDLGSNLFSSWGAATDAYSSAYFFKIFSDIGLPFHRIFAYEYEKLDPHKAWEAVAKEAVSAYTLINHGVESAADSKFNPWNLLREVATPEDFVVVKMDIDSPAIEQSLFEQLMADQKLADLIDEMYFEHHVYVAEMQQYWALGPTNPSTMTTSYKWFSTVRKMGIRMHSWP